MSAGLLRGKVVLITGASSGIGRSCAIAAAREGADIVLHHLGEPTRGDASEVEGKVKQHGRKCVVVEGDVSNPETGKKVVSAALSSYSRIDALISNAGIAQFVPLLQITPSIWQRHQDINLSGSFYVVQAVAEQMTKQELVDGERGSIVGISSISAFMGGGEQCHYTPTKAGIRSLMESCAIALGPYGIRCNSICPGTIVTNLNREHLKMDGRREEQERKVPLGRLGDTDEVADPTIFMISRLARYVNGTSLLVDGGMKISLQ